MQFLATARIWLESIHPAAPWALLTATVFLVIYVSRKIFPRAWIWFDEVTPDGALGHAIMGLPSVLLAALLTPLPGGDYRRMWLAALMGAGAPILHLLLKWAPFVPYAGAVREIASKAGIVVVVMMLGGCVSFGRWSPSAAPEVAVLCALSGEVEPQLEQYANEYHVPLVVVEEAFKLACSDTAKTDPSKAKPAGLVSARLKARTVSAARKP